MKRRCMETYKNPAVHASRDYQIESILYDLAVFRRLVRADPRCRLQNPYTRCITNFATKVGAPTILLTLAGPLKNRKKHES